MLFTLNIEFISLMRQDIFFFTRASQYVFVVLRLTRKIIHSYWDVTIAGEGLQSLTYTRHS